MCFCSRLGSVANLLFLGTLEETEIMIGNIKVRQHRVRVEACVHVCMGVCVCVRVCCGKVLRKIKETGAPAQRNS